jgi:hypothetical protein
LTSTDLPLVNEITGGTGSLNASTCYIHSVEIKIKNSDENFVTYTPDTNLNGISVVTAGNDITANGWKIKFTQTGFLPIATPQVTKFFVTIGDSTTTSVV